jgi:hypothetical protein
MTDDARPSGADMIREAARRAGVSPDEFAQAVMAALRGRQLARRLDAAGGGPAKRDLERLQKRAAEADGFERRALAAEQANEDKDDYIARLERTIDRMATARMRDDDSRRRHDRGEQR